MMPNFLENRNSKGRIWLVYLIRDVSPIVRFNSIYIQSNLKINTVKWLISNRWLYMIVHPHLKTYFKKCRHNGFLTPCSSINRKDCYNKKQIHWPLCNAFCSAISGGFKKKVENKNNANRN